MCLSIRFYIIRRIFGCEMAPRVPSPTICYEEKGIKRPRVRRKAGRHTYQNSIRSVLATSRARQTCSEKPSGSCVCLICLYWGMYGRTPPTTMNEADVQPTRWPTVSPSSSLIIQSIVGICLCPSFLPVPSFWCVSLAGVLSVSY